MVITHPHPYNTSNKSDIAVKLVGSGIDAPAVSREHGFLGSLCQDMDGVQHDHISHEQDQIYDDL